MRKSKVSDEQKLINLFMKEDDPELEKVRELQRARQTLEQQILEAEATLLYYNLKGRGFVEQICPECNRRFAYKYAIASISVKETKKENQRIKIAYKKYAGSFRCSNECRYDALRRIGIEWRPYVVPEERWGMTDQKEGIIPLIVPPDALELVEEKLQEKDDHNNSSAS